MCSQPGQLLLLLLLLFCCILFALPMQELQIMCSTCTIAAHTSCKKLQCHKNTNTRSSVCSSC